MSALRAAQAAYDNQYPAFYDFPDSHEYTGEVWIGELKFDFARGNLESVAVPGKMFGRPMDAVKLTEQADAKAMELWLKEAK